MNVLTIREMAKLWGTDSSDVTGIASKFFVKSVPSGTVHHHHGATLYDADSTALLMLVKKRKQAERCEALARQYRDIEKRIQDWIGGNANEREAEKDHR